MKQRKNRVPIWKILLGSLISLVLFLCALEIILRLIGFKFIFGEHISTVAPSVRFTKAVFGPGCIPSEILGYELEPNFNGKMWGTQLIINSQGFRDTLFSYQKDKSSLRIICLGDSSTLGVKVKAEETYPKQLEKALNENDNSRHYEVLNAGCSGYSSFNGLKLLEDKGLLFAYKPDIVIIYFGLNDHFMWHGLSDTNSYQLRMLNKQFKRSYLYSFLWKASKRILGDKFKLTNKIGKFAVRLPPEEYRSTLKRIITLLQSYKIKAMLITYPVESGLFVDNESVCLERLRSYNGMTREISKKYKINLLDLEKIFSKDANGTKLFADAYHPSGYGHKVIANAIYEELLRGDFFTKEQGLD
jgi:lysophospholipase L1-like esterase